MSGMHDLRGYVTSEHTDDELRGVLAMGGKLTISGKWDPMDGEPVTLPLLESETGEPVRGVLRAVPGKPGEYTVEV